MVRGDTSQPRSHWKRCCSTASLSPPESQEARSCRFHAGNTSLTLTYVLYIPRVAKSAAFKSSRRQLLSGVQADGFIRLSPCALFMSCGRWAAALSCRPRDCGTVLLCFHPQGSDAGGLAVRLAVQLIAIEARAHPSCAKEATHVSLSHVAAGAGDAEELGDTTGCVGVTMGGHAGGHCLAGDNAGRHRGGSAIVADPGGVLDLGMGKEVSGLPCVGCSQQQAGAERACPAPAPASTLQGSPACQGQLVPCGVQYPGPRQQQHQQPPGSSGCPSKSVCQP